MTIEARLVQEGSALDFTTDAAYSAGDVVQLGDGRAGFIATDADSGVLIGVQTEGVVQVIKTATQVWIEGAEIFWDHSANAATCIPRMGAGDRDFFLGCAHADAASAATTGYVRLNVRPNWIIDLARDPFATVVVKTVVGSTTVEVPHTEPRGGGTALILGTTAEAQKVDLLSERSFALGSNWVVEGEVNIITNSDNAAGDFNIGVANATHASDADSITESVFLHTDGNSLNINAESDDGTTEVAATDTTVDFVAGTPFSFVMDGRNPADVQIYIDGVLVLPNSVFNVSAATGPLKLLAHLEKSSDDSPGTYVINRLRVRTSQV